MASERPLVKGHLPRGHVTLTSRDLTDSKGDVSSVASEVKKSDKSDPFEISDEFSFDDGAAAPGGQEAKQNSNVRKFWNIYFSIYWNLAC